MGYTVTGCGKGRAERGPSIRSSPLAQSASSPLPRSPTTRSPTTRSPMVRSSCSVQDGSSPPKAVAPHLLRFALCSPVSQSPARRAA